jgi:hypothetical protein
MALAAASVLPLWASIVIAASSSVVAIVAVVVGIYTQTRTLRHERQRDDLSDVRTVLDAGARALSEADLWWRRVIDDLDNQAKRKKLDDAGATVDKVTGQLAVRFSRQHDVTTTFEACASELRNVLSVLEDFPPRSTPSGHREFHVAGERFEQARPAFIDEATKYAGVELPPRA